jgi:hypothetical protein
MHIRFVLTAFAALLLIFAASLLVSSPPAGAAPGWSWPVEGEVLTGYRNGDDPYAGGQHRGIDIAAQAGTPVGAAAAGTVRFAGAAGSSGLTVSVRTSDGTLDTSYLHLSTVAVREGDQVAAGQRLGAVGMTGRRSVDAPHLHFGVRDAGSRHAYHDPLSYLPPPAPRGAPEPPRVPVPVPVPVPVAPGPVRAPDPVRVPAGRRVRLPAERRVRVPAGRRLRMPVWRRTPGAAPAPVPVRVPALGGAPVPALAGDPAAAVSQGAPAPVEGAADKSLLGEGVPRVGPLGSAQRLAAVDGADPSPTVNHHSAEAERSAGGPDIGWALACAGLLLAAALLGRPGDRDGSGTARGRARAGAAVKLRALIKPLTGGGR